VNHDTAVKYKHQIVLKGSNVDVGHGPGVLVEEERELSEQTIRLLRLNSPSILFAKTDCDVMFMMEHIEVKMVRA